MKKGLLIWVVDKYCVTCHNERLKTAGLTLDRADVSRVGDSAEAARKSAPQAAHRSDAAVGRPRPDPRLIGRRAPALEGMLDRAAAAHAATAGRPTLHRVNRAEYAQRRSAICWQSTSTAARCYRPTIRATDSTTSAMCCRFSPGCSSAT